MAYPYSHRTRKTEPECFPYKPLGPGDGQGVGGSASNQISDMDTVVTYTVNPIYGQYKVAIHAWHGAQTMVDPITLKIRPWVDHGQTIPGNALNMFELGSATLATAITLSATSVAAGAVVQVVPGADAAGANPGTVAQAIGPSSHGFGITVNVGTNVAGTFDFEAVFQRTQ